MIQQKLNSTEFVSYLQHIVTLTVIFLLCSGCAAAAPEKEKDMRTQTVYERQAGTHAKIYATEVASPLGRLILIRKGNDACAIRFTSFHRDYDAKPATTFHSGEENVYAEYDWYYQGDGSFDFRKENVTTGHEKLHNGPSIGIGRMAFKSGLKYWITCGPFNLEWTYPISLVFGGFNGKWDSVVELAPTKWQAIDELDFKNSKLRWIRFNEHQGPASYIPMEQLP